MIAEIEAVVWNKLRYDSTLDVSTGVYLHEVPEEELRPCVVIEASLRPEGGGTAPVHVAEIRTSVYARQHAQNETLAEKVRTALEGLMYGAPGLRLGPLELVQVEPGYEVIWDQYRLTMVWSAVAVLWATA